VARDNIDEFDNVYSMIEESLREDVCIKEWLPARRPNEQHTEYQRQERNVGRRAEQDRVYPLETVELQRFNAAHGTDLDKATIHTGPYADELARSMNALAMTIGVDIFFRSNAFGTGSEESRKTLSHELAHVGQHAEGRLSGGSSVEELEEEAEAHAEQEAYGEDPYVTVELDGREYTVNTLEIDMMAEELANMIDQKVRERWHFMEEVEYLRLLVEYKAILEGGVHGIFDEI
jgi:hypothetical protein